MHTAAAAAPAGQRRLTMQTTKSLKDIKLKKHVHALWGAEYFITPRANLGSSCAEAKILRHINDALTTAITVPNTKGPQKWTDLSGESMKAAGSFLWRLVVNIIYDWMTHVSVRVWERVGWDLVYLPFLMHLYPPLPPLLMELGSIWRFSAELHPMGDPSLSLPLINLNLLCTKTAWNGLGRNGYGCSPPNW